MSTLSKSLKAAAGNAGGDAPNVEDVFSTYLYDGNGSAQTITNGIDLAGEGGMVWIKNRDAADNHVITDTIRGVGETFSLNGWVAALTDLDTITAFTTSGFTLGADVKVNTNTEAYASWTFRKAPRFFDIVTYTGNDTAGHEIAHNLGVAPGMIVVHKTDSVGSAYTLHKDSVGSGQGHLYRAELSNSAAPLANNALWDSTAPTDSVFTVGTSDTNVSNVSYIAYLFAHDPVGENDDGMIACGSFNTDGSGNATD